MMTEKSTYIWILVLVVAFTWCDVSFPQEENTAKLPILMNIPPSAKITLSSDNGVFSAINGSGAQQIISPRTKGSFWLNYSSVMENSSTNSISASIAADDLPGDVAVDLIISQDAGAGIGQVGKATGEIRLSSYPQIIVTNIGTCFTGQGPKKGHQLTYKWKLLPGHDPSMKLDSLDLQIGVIYTITTAE